MTEEMEQKKSKLTTKIKVSQSFWEGKAWGLRTKQSLFKEIFNTCREEFPTPKGWHDSFYVLENTEGKVFVAGTYTPGKSPGAYKVQEEAWKIELEEEEEGLTYSRYISKEKPCPLRLRNGHYESLLRQLNSGVGKRMIFHLLIFRINRPTPYIRGFRNGEVPSNYEERLPFILSLEVHPRGHIDELVEKVKKIQERKKLDLA